MPEAGQTVGHYTLLERIGAGGMGEVFRARDEKLKRVVAIKFLSREAVADPSRRERFWNEARAASALNHPGIVTIHEIGESQPDGRAYIVMEYVEGQSLRQALASGPPAFDRALDIACQVAETLALAHEKGIVHRDLKPDNIMLSTAGYAKLLDFGLAKLKQPESGLEESLATRGTLTEPGAVMGTVAYMSPEQLQAKTADNRSDIFSFGLVLFEVFTGRRPFADRSGVDLMHAILHDELPPLQSLQPNLPAELARIVETATSKSPDERYQSTRDLALELKRLKRETESGKLESRQARMPAPQKRWPRALLLVGAPGVLVLSLALLWKAGVFHGVAPRPPGAKKALAVVQLENLTQDRSLDWLDRGVAELLTTNLAQAQALDVISTERVQSLISRRVKGEAKLPSGQAAEVARDARADLFLSGALLKVGPRLRLDLRVQETATGRVLFSEKVEGNDAQAVFAMVDQATAGILAKLTPGEATARPNVAASMTANVEALRAYEEGKRYFDRLLMEDTVAAFRRATELDPNFAMAHYQLAWAFTFTDRVQGRQAIAQAGQLAERLPLPRQQKLLIQAAQLSFDRRLEEANRVLEAAVQEFPREIEPRMLACGNRMTGWKYGEIIPIAEEILRIDDRQAGTCNILAYAYAMEGNLARALASVDRYASLLPPNDPNPLDTRGDLLAMHERYEEAIAVYRKNLELNPQFMDFVPAAKLALSYLHTGRYPLAAVSAESVYDKSKGLARGQAASVLGDIEVGRGRLDRAVVRYEEAARLYAAERPLLASAPLLKAAEIYFEQQQPEAALALGGRHKAPWGPAVRALALLVQKKDAAAEKELGAFRASLAPLAGDYLAGQWVELLRFLAAGSAGRPQQLTERWQKLNRQFLPLFSLDLGRAYLETDNLPEAERHLRFVLLAQRNWGSPAGLASHDFLGYTLAQFYLGKILERNGKKAEAARAYQEFLGHFENSTARLPQIAEARAALKRLL